MNHVRELLGDHIDGELEPARRAEVDAHLDACLDCARELDELRDTVALLRELPEPEPPRHFAGAVMARIAEGEGRPPWHVRLSRSLAFSHPVAAAAVAGMAGFVIFLGLGDLLGTRSGPALDGFPVMMDSGAIAGVLTAPTRRPSGFGRAPANPAIRTAASFPRFDPPGSGDLRSAFEGTAIFDRGVPRLDYEIQQLMEDPQAFLDGMSGVPAAQRRISLLPLVQRSVSRDEALNVAHRLRTTRHPLAPAVAEQFERASFSR